MTKSDAFLFSGYTFDQERDFKFKREQLREQLQREFDAITSEE